MLFVNFVRFLLGYVSFTARGGFPERFLNLCRLNKIFLWELKSRNGVVSACADRRDYKRIRSAARKSGMKVRINKKHGLPFFMEKHKNRAGIIAGIFICTAVLLILSTRIWSVDVIGNVNVSSEKIIEVFESLGVRKGASASRIDIKSTELAALKKLQELSWLNINFTGSKALIEVREAVITPEKGENSLPADLVAARDGIITIIRPFNGTAEQEAGNAVAKGDLLISGIVENGDSTVRFCRAKGYVVAKTIRRISYSLPQTINAKIPVSAKKRFAINFLSFEIPLGKINRENSCCEKYETVINGVTLPFGFKEYTETVSEEKQTTLSLERRKNLAFLCFADMCVEEFRCLQVEKSEVKTDKNGRISGEFICLENIGKEHPMQIEEMPQTETADP